MNSGLRAETASQVKAMISTLFGVSADAVSDQTVVDDIDGWDSATHVGLILALEEKLGIEFDIARIGSFENVGELIDECALILEKARHRNT